MAFQGPSAEPWDPADETKQEERGGRRRPSREGPGEGVCQLCCAILDKSLNPSVLYAVQLQNSV